MIAQLKQIIQSGEIDCKRFRSDIQLTIILAPEKTSTEMLRSSYFVKKYYQTGKYKVKSIYTFTDFTNIFKKCNSNIQN